MTATDVEDLKQFIVIQMDGLKGYVDTVEQRLIKRMDDQAQQLRQEMGEGFTNFEQRFTRLEQHINDVEQRLEQKMDDGFAGIGQAIDGLIEDFDQRQRRVERLAHSHPRPKLLVKRP